MSVGLRSEEFNIVSNDHGRTQKCDFCVSIGKTNFKDHHTPYTIESFKDSVLVCKMLDSYSTVPYAKILKIFIPFHQSSQVMQAIAIVKLYENKPLQNPFKHI